MQRTLFFILLVYCFVFGIFGREVGGLPYGVFIEVFLVLIFIATLVQGSGDDWRKTNTDLFYILLIWFTVSLLEVFNPGAAFMGWVNEIRTTALYPLTMVALGLAVFKTKKDLDVFLVIILMFSTFATLNGIKQLYIGLFPGEADFLRAHASTHLLWGRLRVFSFYSDAGQFGASQAHIGLMALVLALAPMKIWKKILYLVCAALNLYGMLISGTRGALFIFFVAAFMAILLSKNWKVLILGGCIGVLALGTLKFTHIGDGNYQIYRLRSALNPQDASLNVRFETQQQLSVLMADLPFGGGLGILGYNGNLYNSDKYLSTIQPDSYFVKIWVMYGVVGLTIWFTIMMFILGKCCAIAWTIRNSELRVKIIALTAGFAGILVGCYGNEVINIMPTSIIVYLSWVFIYKSPSLDDDPIEKVDNLAIDY
ncbi:hypothetical protein ACVWYG_000208 [Pedobacter sp. UYEF25]